MRLRGPNIIASVAFAWVLALALSLAPAINVVTHNSAALAQAENQRAAAHAVADPDHGHVHEDGDIGDHQRTGHWHGHDPADHTHDTATPVRLRSPTRLIVTRMFGLAPLTGVAPNPHFRLDRPPRRLLVS